MARMTTPDLAPAGELEEKLRFAIVLALTPADADRALLERQDARGHQLGFMRAEIALARRGLGFDYRTSKALALAAAAGDGALQRRREEALRAGIDPQTCARIERLALELSISSSFERKKNAT